MITHPRAGELLDAMIAYLAEPGGPRAGYPALVARNALGIVRRELELAPAADARAAARLRALLGQQGDLATLETTLCARLRDGTQAPDAAALLAHLREQVLDHLAIDQPRYRHELSP